jgi:hypothetical protein
MLGFAEGLPIELADRAQGVIARLECGRIGVAVEFYAPDARPAYSIVPLLPAVSGSPSVTTDLWSDIVRDVRRRAPPTDDD